jgi:hypothetical protein
MSRIGRDYLQTGFYTEVFFREKSVRFIAVANNIDSQNKDSGEFAPFLNIMSEWYLRDSSRKVKAAHKARGMSGKRLTFTPIYGYKLDPNDKEKWIVDPEASSVVRRLFNLTIEGKGPVQIARIFAEDEIERPSYYQHTHGIVNFRTCLHKISQRICSGFFRRTRRTTNVNTLCIDEEDNAVMRKIDAKRRANILRRHVLTNVHDLTAPYAWSGNTIAHMIGKPEYKGHTVNFRTYKDSYKDKRAKDNPQEEWLIFENTHEAIIDSDTWETAQRCRKTVRRTDHGEANPLTGLVFCADCGAKLYNHRMPYPTTQINKKGYVCNRPPKDVYTCSTYNLTGRRFDRKCTNHQIRTVVLRELALDAIKSVSGYVKKHESEFVKQVLETSAIRQEETASAHRKRIVKEKKRIAELNTLIRRIYEDNVSGKLTDKRFAALSAEYENEQTELEQSIITLQDELDSFTADSAKAEKFISLVKKYTDFSELTPQMIAEYIEKIVVHEADKSSGERQQRVDIHLNFIGKFEVPAAEPTAEEIAAEAKAFLKREQRREAQRRYSAKQKQKQQDQEESERKISA